MDQFGGKIPLPSQVEAALDGDSREGKGSESVRALKLVEGEELERGAGSNH